MVAVAKFSIKGWAVQFTSGERGWTTAIHGTLATSVDAQGVFRSRAAAREFRTGLRPHLAPTTRYRIRRATVTLTIED